ncbi:MAG: isoprenylcysteine carboxylmethyltransferase family protein [Flavobacteriaceae bacterium]|nr:isoprenylcysteine carboxylmethyltransferase family protein [Flavobacteriaceae bacterium]
MILKIPPVVQFLICVLLMWALNRFTTTNHFNFEYQKFISWIFFGFGILIGLLAVNSFRKAATTTDPMYPGKASNLVVKGLYKYTRNPMYLALLFILLAFFMRLGNLNNLFVVVLFIWYITKFQIKPEEAALTKRFGNQYLNYKSKVRRWI